jgi:starch synthase (maltosyl-transferring)
MQIEGRKRVVVERIYPDVDCGRFPAKRVIGEALDVRADIFTDGHDEVSARMLYRGPNDTGWHSVPMRHIGNDAWAASFVPESLGFYTYTVEACLDHFKTWQHDFGKKLRAGQDVSVELVIGADLVKGVIPRASEEDAAFLERWEAELRNPSTRENAVALAESPQVLELLLRYPDPAVTVRFEGERQVWVDPTKALFSTWYELFPRSCGSDMEHGTLSDCQKQIPRIAEMGFDVLYLPPIHPIGEVNRKGKNNNPRSSPGDVGSPWAIGSRQGGHTAIHPELGKIDDLIKLRHSAERHGMSLALDLAFQCAPDHPWVKEHPEWFRWRPDGTVQYAENPPKKYEDILPLNFETEHWRDLWEELKRVVLFWADHGIRIFRVDNPHTKPFAFWEWLIGEVKREFPETLFLSEAFTRPKVMKRLAKLGFSHSYTYFTWRNTKQEIIDYATELTQSECAEYLRPSFWPNTPDILPEYLQYGGRDAFIVRLVLAATLSSNYGIYGPAFELCVNAAVPGKEEYLYSEKYEVKDWKLDEPGSISDTIRIVNSIRKENPALQRTRNLRFYDVDNEQLVVYERADLENGNVILVAVNLDPFTEQSGWASIPLERLGIEESRPYFVHDLMSDEKHLWRGPKAYIDIKPSLAPAHIYRIHTSGRRESSFDYYM